MSDTRDLVKIFYELVTAVIEDPGVNLVAPVTDYVNSTDDPALNLVVLTATTITQYALLLEQTTASKQAALARAHQALLLNELEAGFEEQDIHHE